MDRENHGSAGRGSVPRLASRLLLAAAGLLACGPQPAEEATPAAEAPPAHAHHAGHEASPEAEAAAGDPEIGAEFAAICQSIKDSYDPFYGELRARELEARLAAAGDPGTRVPVQAALGRELLKLDRAAEAIELLTAAAAGARELGLEPSFVLDVEIYLGLAHLQLAEDQNCLAHHSADSCILPFRAGAIHRLAGHSRKAGDVFLEVAREHPGAVHSLWLLNLARMVSGDYPEGVPERFRLPPRALEGAPFPRWVDRAGELGIGVVDLAGGAVMDDFDGDGVLDLVSSTWDPCGPMKAFRNDGVPASRARNDGAGGFENVARAWGLDEQRGGLNLVQADYDNDGHLDLLVLRGAWMGPLGRIRNSLLRNELHENGRFRDVTREAGLAEPAYPTQAASWADYDGDGDLDLYVGNEDPDGKSFPSQLFRNNGDGTFADLAAEAGVANHRFAKAVAWGDYDDDGDPDLYVSNSGPNRLYRNNADGTFTDVGPRLGVTEPAGRSFATWFFDYDNDGDLDLFVADYQAPVPAVTAVYFGAEITDYGPRLYRNDGGSFTDVGKELGLGRPLLPMGANYGDLDVDGFPDVYLGTGEPGYETVMPNVMFHNDRGRRFEDVTSAGGFGQLQKGHGVAFGDVDNDGDQDLFHQLGGFFPGDSYANALYENPTRSGEPAGAAWITLRLSGRKANAFGVGARIEVRIVERGRQRSVHVLAGSGGSFGGSSMQQEIGLGSAQRIEEVVVRWPGSGTVQRFSGVAINRVYRVVEGEASPVPVELPRLRLGG